MAVNRPLILLLAGFSTLLHTAAGQEATDDSKPDQRWNIHFQATSIGQRHGSFPSPYQGDNSLPPYPEKRVSVTGTLFLAVKLNRYMEVVVNPELAGGKGFGQVTGIAGFTNGEIPRVASAAPEIYLARAYLRTTWAIGAETQAIEGGANQLAGTKPVRRFTWIAGKFGLSDFFDNNTYSHDPRSQFMNWSLMYNGAWDYPSDVRGYTIATMEELTMRRWSLRAATALEPTAANGPTLDSRIGRNRGEVVEWEQRFSPLGHHGALRVLGYLNQEHAGTFRLAILPDGTTDLDATRRHGTKKYGFGLNLEQEIRPGLGVFGRYGWSDGKTEAWAFTQIDRTLSGGVSIHGRFWKRPDDHIGIGAVRNYLSGDQRNFLAAGGLGFIIGDGRLNYRPEQIVEAYYSWRALKQWTLTGDFQHIQNPAYNHDRGPVSALSLRVHWER